MFSYRNFISPDLIGQRSRISPHPRTMHYVTLPKLQKSTTMLKRQPSVRDSFKNIKHSLNSPNFFAKVNNQIQRQQPCKIRIIKKSSKKLNISGTAKGLMITPKSIAKLFFIDVEQYIQAIQLKYSSLFEEIDQDQKGFLDQRNFYFYLSCNLVKNRLSQNKEGYQNELAFMGSFIFDIFRLDTCNSVSKQQFLSICSVFEFNNKYQTLDISNQMHIKKLRGSLIAAKRVFKSFTKTKTISVSTLISLCIEYGVKYTDEVIMNVFNRMEINLLKFLRSIPLFMYIHEEIRLKKQKQQ